MEASLEDELMDSAFFYRSVYNFQMPLHRLQDLIFVTATDVTKLQTFKSAIIKYRSINSAVNLM